MTKRLTMTLVALALFVLLAVMPAAAMSASPVTGLFNGSVIMSGTPVPTVFIGEDNLNLTPALSANTYIIPPGSALRIGWWAPGTFTYPNNPSQTLDVSTRLNSFAVTSQDFGSYTGSWYCLTGNGTTAINAIFTVADPSQVITVWDVRANNGLGQDMTGKSVVRGSVLTFRIDTNLAAFTAGSRSNTRFSQTTTWNNGTCTLMTVKDSNVYSCPITVNGITYPGFNWLNTTPTAPTALGTANVLTFTNFSSNWTNVYGPAIFQNTMFFNNTDTVGTGETASGCLNLTADANGRGIVTVAVGQPSTFFNAANMVTPAFTGALTNTGLYSPTPTATTADGFITVRLKDEGGNVQTRVYRDQAGTLTYGLQHQWVSTQPWYFGTNQAGTPFTGSNGALATGWVTDAIDAGLGTNAYPAGTYTVWTESTLSKMKDNYKLNGADYTGKTLSATGTVTLVSDTVKIEANKETVVRSKPFSVTITGRPLTQYFVWVKGTSSMTGGYDNQPPMISLYQAGVYNDTPFGNLRYPLGMYAYENAVNRVVRDDVALDTATDAPLFNKTRYYIMINTSASGTRTVEFVTTNATKAQTYTIRVEQNFPIGVSGFPTAAAVAAPDVKSDEVDVKVEKGAVTITASGDQSYYLGEEIKFSGTNTETQTTFLFLTGPNLWPEGSRFYPLAPSTLDPRRSSLNQNSRVMDGQPASFVQRAVNADNTWDWKWGTANYALDAGTYTVYAISGPKDALNLGNVAYGTVAIIIKKPFVSATASQSTLAQGDKLFITGTAEGKPQTGVAIWILGKNYATRTTQSVNADASFSYEVTTATTTSMDAGQYFVVVQHPMQNQQFDVALCSDDGNVVCNLQQGTSTTSVGAKVFTLLGAGSLQGTDAAEALVQGINSPNVDDTYTKLVFLVEVPSIRIDPVGDRHVGDKFTITATTNLAVDDEVQMTVVSSSFKPTQKSQSGEFSGASGTVKVTKGDTGLNKISFDVDASTFKPDEYIATASRILLPAATNTALFNVLEGAAPTAVPTKVVTTAGPTAAQTTVATPVPTATPTKTPTQPGFGALVALIGLGAVAFFVVRRH